MKLQFTVERGTKPGVLIASWDDPKGGGITTHANGIEELVKAIKKAVRCHFVGRPSPKRAELRFMETPELELVA
jgi:hypothetical protein